MENKRTKKHDISYIVSVPGSQFGVVGLWLEVEGSVYRVWIVRAEDLWSVILCN